jgi:hypothetical protein
VVERRADAVDELIAFVGATPGRIREDTTGRAVPSQITGDVKLIEEDVGLQDDRAETITNSIPVEVLGDHAVGVVTVEEIGDSVAVVILVANVPVVIPVEVGVVVAGRTQALIQVIGYLVTIRADRLVISGHPGHDEHGVRIHLAKAPLDLSIGESASFSPGVL